MIKVKIMIVIVVMATAHDEDNECNNKMISMMVLCPLLLLSELSITLIM